MTFLAFSGLLNFAASFFLAFFVLFRNPKSVPNRSYFYLNISIALFGFGYFMWQMSPGEVLASFWMKILLGGVILINPTFLHFVFAFLDILKARKREIYYYYTLNLLFLVCDMGSLFFSKVEPRDGLGFWPIPQPLFNVYVVFWFWQLAYACFWLIRGWKLTKGIRREQIKLLTIASVMGFVGGATNWPMWYGIHFPPYATALVGVYIAIMAYAIIRFKYLNAAVLTVQGFFLAFYSPVLGAPFLYGHLTHNWAGAVVMAIAAGACGSFVYRALIPQAHKQIFADEWQYHEMLKKIAYQTLSYHDTQRLTRYIVRTCVKAASLESAFIFVRNREKKCFELSAVENQFPLSREALIAMDHPLLKALEKGPDYVNVEAVLLGYDAANSYGWKEALKKFAKDYNVSLVFAIRSQDALLGILALGPKQNGSAYTSGDVDVFSLLSSQSALAIENCRYLEEINTLYQKAVTDKLTGCYNRQFYDDYMKKTVENSRREGTPLYFLMIDLNHFKIVNDTYGHETGDRVLAGFGAFLKRHFRKTDVVVRYGGDEFGVLIANTSRADCESVIKRFLVMLGNDRVAFDYQGEAISLKISVSIGIGQLRENQSAEELAKSSDTALYEAKKRGVDFYFSES